MKQQLNFISLGVKDVSASREFYIDGLGWEPHFEVPGEVIFLQANHGLILGLWNRSALAKELGVAEAQLALKGIPSLTLSHNLSSIEEVDQVLADATSAGAQLQRPGTLQPWGGYSGYFADPDGFMWEIAYNPTWTVAPDGHVTV